METVNFPCAHCGKLMAVSTDHLGSQVQCPHCQGIVQAPAAPAPTSRPGVSSPLPQFQTLPAGERESIFAGEEHPSDDLFGAPAEPLVELPVPVKKPEA